jgi:D-alanine-D-alanine ligase
MAGETASSSGRFAFTQPNRQQWHMNITILTYLEKEGGPVTDASVAHIEEALRASKHNVSILGIHGKIHELIDGLAERKPDLVFNLMEMFGKNWQGDVGVAGLLQLLGYKFTGCGPGEFYLRQDKGLAKKILAFEQIATPNFAVFIEDAGFETGGNLRMPLFVKPLRADSSQGIDAGSLVHDTKSLMERVKMINEKINDAALAEEYIDGREFYVSILGNGDPQALPPVEMDFSGMPEDLPHIMDHKAKWVKRSKAYKGTKPVVADIPDELRAKLHKISLTAARALRALDYARVDLRVDQTGDIYVLEVNSSCDLDKNGEYAMAAAAGGLDYPALIEKIVEAALARYPKQRTS